MTETTVEEPKPTKDVRREQTERAYAAIVDEERRARTEKNKRLRSMRLVRQ